MSGSYPAALGSRATWPAPPKLMLVAEARRFAPPPVGRGNGAGGGAVVVVAMAVVAGYSSLTMTFLLTWWCAACWEWDWDDAWGNVNGGGGAVVVGDMMDVGDTTSASWPPPLL
jgi:hypothetical protein